MAAVGVASCLLSGSVLSSSGMMFVLQGMVQVLPAVLHDLRDPLLDEALHHGKRSLTEREELIPHIPAVSAGAEVRNVAGLSYTTSRAFIFPSRGCSWASHSVLAALVDPNLLVHLKAAMLCRSKDAAGEPPLRVSSASNCV